MECVYNKKKSWLSIDWLVGFVEGDFLIYIYVYIYRCIHTYIHTYTHTYIHTYIYASIGTMEYGALEGSFGIRTPIGRTRFINGWTVLRVLCGWGPWAVHMNFHFEPVQAPNWAGRSGGVFLLGAGG